MDMLPGEILEVGEMKIEVEATEATEIKEQTNATSDEDKMDGEQVYNDNLNFISRKKPKLSIQSLMNSQINFKKVEKEDRSLSLSKNKILAIANKNRKIQSNYLDQLLDLKKIQGRNN